MRLSGWRPAASAGGIYAAGGGRGREASPWRPAAAP